jgi:hypothetical protein
MNTLWSVGQWMNFILCQNVNWKSPLFNIWGALHCIAWSWWSAVNLLSVYWIVMMIGCVLTVWLYCIVMMIGCVLTVWLYCIVMMIGCVLTVCFYWIVMMIGCVLTVWLYCIVMMIGCVVTSTVLKCFWCSFCSHLHHITCQGLTAATYPYPNIIPLCFADINRPKRTKIQQCKPDLVLFLI